MDDEYWDDDPIETDELDEWGCLFGDKCLMPGEHLKKDCHTAEMMEQQTGQGNQSQLVQIPAEEYQVLLAIAQSARILAAGQEREPYYESEWMRLDGEIIRWVNSPEKKDGLTRNKWN